MMKIVSAVLIMGRVRKMWTMEELAFRANVSLDSVFDAENFLDYVPENDIKKIWDALELELTSARNRQWAFEQRYKTDIM